MTLSLKLSLAALALSIAAPGLAATLIVEDGLLRGASGLEVNGVDYDVQFVGGTCAEAFGACDMASFTFTSETDALQATRQLRDFVFVDAPDGDFDFDPGLTWGCVGTENCVAIVPYATRDLPIRGRTIDIATVTNRPARRIDTVETSFTYAALTDLERDSGAVWARFTLSSPTVPAVPEPATWGMMIGGLGLVGASMRRRKTAVSFA